MDQSDKLNLERHHGPIVADESQPARRLGIWLRRARSTLRQVLVTMGSRLRARRWLLVSAAIVMLAFTLFAGLPASYALLGFGIITASAAVFSGGVDVKSDGLSISNELRMARAEQSHHRIIRALPDPAVLFNARGEIAAYNDPAIDLLGEMAEGKHMTSVIRNPEFLDALNGVKASGASATIVYTDRVPVDRKIAAALTAMDTGDFVGGPKVILAIFKDLTERDRIDKMRADFIANASHELRTPLASLMGFIDTLQGSARNDAEARDRFLGIMAMQAQRMTRLIDDLLSLSRVEMNVHLLPSGLVDLNEAVCYVADTLDPLAGGRDIELNVEPLDRRVFVRGEREELVQVFQNLIQNAIKYGREGGHVTVRVAERRAEDRLAKSVAVEISDDGPGIAPQHLPRLTERFYRVDDPSSRDKGGTGLGLAIVKHVVNRHRGELEISSSLGKGSTFSVVLDEIAPPADL